MEILFINIIIYLFIDYSVLDLKDQFSLYFVNSLKLLFFLHMIFLIFLIGLYDDKFNLEQILNYNFYNSNP